MAATIERANTLIQELGLPNAFALTANVEKTGRARAVVVDSALRPLPDATKAKLLADLANNGGQLFVLHEISTGSAAL